MLIILTYFFFCQRSIGFDICAFTTSLSLAVYGTHYTICGVSQIILEDHMTLLCAQDAFDTPET